MFNYNPYSLKIYFDGSALKNPGGPGGIAGIVEYPESFDKNYEIVFKKGFFETTNQRMELRACLEAFKYLQKNQNLLKIGQMAFITDSLYIKDNENNAIYWRSNKWRNESNRPIENSDLWKDFLSLKQKFKVFIEWQKGKTTEILEQVDILAKIAAKNPTEIDFGFISGKVSRSKMGRNITSELFNNAQSRKEMIRIYRKKSIGKEESKIYFEVYSKKEKSFTNKCCAYAGMGLACNLHRAHCYRVLFNGNVSYPIIERIMKEIKIK